MSSDCGFPKGRKHALHQMFPMCAIPKGWWCVGMFISSTHRTAQRAKCGRNSLADDFCFCIFIFYVCHDVKQAEKPCSTYLYHYASHRVWQLRKHRSFLNWWMNAFLWVIFIKFWKAFFLSYFPEVCFLNPLSELGRVVARGGGLGKKNKTVMAEGVMWKETWAYFSLM